MRDWISKKLNGFYGVLLLGLICFLVGETIGTNLESLPRTARRDRDREFRPYVVGW